MYFRTEGVILSRRNFGEADRILSIYTRDFGKVSALAKGVRRPRSKKAGHVEIGNWCKVFIAKGKNLDVLTEVELKKAFGIEDFNSEKTNQIYHLLELVEKLTAERQKNVQVFQLLVNFLSKIGSSEFNLISIIFKVKILSILGFYSVKNLKDSDAKRVLQVMEDYDFEEIRKKIKLDKTTYLKLLEFLDSMIEDLTERKLSTKRFLNGE